jgi:DNA invertase Pin-like site-specific DNA recombinase
VGIVNKLVATTLAAIATFENERRRERQRHGILEAKKQNKYKGRKTVIDKKLIKRVQTLKEDSKLSVSEIAKVTSRSRSTIYKILKTKLGYVSPRLVKIDTK